MFRHGRGRTLLAAVALIAAAACSESPTSPSPVSSSPSSSTAESADPDAVSGTQDIFTGPINAIGATRFVAFGDSITEGVESQFDEVLGDFALIAATPVSYPTQLAPYLVGRFPSQGPAFQIFNHGVGGETAATGEGRLASVLSSRQPQILLLLEGINDLNGGASVSATVGHLEAMVEMAQLFNVPVVIGTMFQTYEAQRPDGTIRGNANHLITSFNSAIRQMAMGRQNVFVAPIFEAFGTDRSLVGGDGLHPTPDGYLRMAQTFGAAAATAFPVRGAFQ